MDKEMRAYWDKTTLIEYLSLARIPRGKKFPTFDIFDEDLKTRWMYTLSTFSHKLMSLIIESKVKERYRLQQDICTIQEELLSLKELTQFADLDKRLDDKMNQLEKDIIAAKKE